MTHYNVTQNNVEIKTMLLIIHSITFAKYECDVNVKWSNRTKYVQHFQTASRLHEIKYTNEVYSARVPNRRTTVRTEREWTQQRRHFDRWGNISDYVAESTFLSTLTNQNPNSTYVSGFVMSVRTSRNYPWLHSPFVGPSPLFQFLNPYIVGTMPWTGDQPVAMPLPIHRTTQKKCTQTSMPWVGFELTIPVFERAKTVRALNRAATVTLWRHGTTHPKLNATCAQEAWKGMKGVTAQSKRITVTKLLNCLKTRRLSERNRTKTRSINSYYLHKSMTT
jgi:hypothetical protein